MTRVRHCLAIITVACLTSLGPVQADNSAGVLREVQGRVLVNKGKHYVVGYSGMPLKPGARVLTMDGASAVVNQTDGSLTPLDPNSLFILRGPATYRGGAATVRENGPYSTESIGTSALRDAPSVAVGAASDRVPPMGETNRALGGSAGAVMGGATETMGVIPEAVDDRPPPVSPFR